MNELLEGQEVLSFGVDDYIASERENSFNRICVQAKNLQLYIIDYEKEIVVSKANQMFPIVRESIYFNPMRYKKPEK